MNRKLNLREPEKLPLSDEDVVEGMRLVGSYFDISPHDFRMLYAKIFPFSKKRILENTKAKEIMTKPVFCAHFNSNLENIIEVFSEKNISGLPIIDDQEKIVGILSEKDIIKQLGIERGTAAMNLLHEILQGKKPCIKCLKTLKAKDIMVKDIISVSLDESLLNIVQIFLENKINRLPVLSAEHKLLGIISRTDLINAYSNLL